MLPRSTTAHSPSPRSSTRACRHDTLSSCSGSSHAGSRPISIGPVEHDARAHVGPEDDDERRRDRLAQLALQRLAQAVRVVVERLGSQRRAAMPRSLSSSGIALESTTGVTLC